MARLSLVQAIAGLSQNKEVPILDRIRVPRQRQLRMFGHEERVPRAASCELETICSTLLRALVG